MPKIHLQTKSKLAEATLKTIDPKTLKFILLCLALFVIFTCAFFAAVYLAPFYFTPSSTNTPIPSVAPTQTTTPTQTATLEPTSTSIPTATQRPTGYEVKPGDTLAKIADLFQIPVDYLAKVNNITDVNFIYAGQILQIPAEYIPLTATPIAQVPGKMIYVILSEQTVYVYEDNVLLKQFLISSGIPGFDTVTGDYLIYSKLPVTRMTGPGYDLDHVPWVMYFHLGYSLHGTYWHHNFGHPMSHGCLNMQTDDAKWLYDWTPIGTLVRIVP